MTAPALAIDAGDVSFSGMHVPIKTLMRRAGINAYQLANAFEERGLSAMAAYRFVAHEGKQARYDKKVIDALADIFEIPPERAHELIVLPKRKDR